MPPPNLQPGVPGQGIFPCCAPKWQTGDKLREEHMRVLTKASMEMLVCQLRPHLRENENDIGERLLKVDAQEN